MSRAYLDAQGAAGAVLRRNLQQVLLILEFAPPARGGFQMCWSLGQDGGICQLAANGGVRTDQNAFAALNTKRFIPYWNIRSKAALFPLRRSAGVCAVDGKSTNRQLVAMTGDHHRGDTFDKV